MLVKEDLEGNEPRFGPKSRLVATNVDLANLNKNKDKPIVSGFENSGLVVLTLQFI